MMRYSRSFRVSRRPAVPAGRRVAGRPARDAAGTQPELPPEDSLLFPQALADKVPLILFSYDLQRRRLLRCNQHCQTVLGYSGQELLHLGEELGPKLLHPDSLTQVRQSNLSALLTEGHGLNWDCRLRHRDGSWRWLRIRLQAGTKDPTGQAVEMLGSAEDVTRHRAALEELRQSRHLLRQVVDMVPNLLYIYDLDQERNTYSNRRTEQVMGYSSEELLAFPEGMLLAAVMPPETFRQVREHFALVARLPDGETRTIEFAVHHRDGELRWLRGTHAPFARAADGRVVSIIGVAENITERRTADERSRADTAHIAEQHRLFRQVIDALPHPVYLKDGHGNYLLANSAMAALYGTTPEELLRKGEHNVPAASTHDTERYLAQDQQVLSTGQDLNIEESYTYPNGEVAWFSSVKRLFVRTDGTAQVLGADSNITELKRTQLALETAIATAEVDAQAKQDFLANMSHEIRTPLHGILGLTSVLAKTTLSRSQHDYLRLLAESADHLLMVLNDVLTTARLGAGKLRPETAPFNPEELLLGCAALLRPRAREKGLRLRVSKPTALPPVLGDAHRLRQVLLNLVSNAIKFTITGQVLLRCRAVPPPRNPTELAGTVWLQFTVSDTGVGMSPQTLAKVFEPFAQAAASTDREYGGTGLGLSISEGLVRLMGGVLQVSSEVDQGSTFAFTLAFPPVPAAAAPGTTRERTPSVAPAGGRILLVEDNLVNSLLAETVLRNWGWQVTTATSGPAAIQLFEHRSFDLVLMDIQMPGMDGETAARFLREHPDPVRAATPVIALTARAQAGEAERLQANGFAGYLAKPYREEQLLETMHAVLARQQLLAAPPPLCNPTAAMTSATPLYDLSNVRQLVRQDEAIVRRLAWAFIETTPAILAALDEALTRGNWEEVGDAAHHLKSSLDGLGVESLRHIIREIENYGATPPTPLLAAQQVAQVRATTEQVMADLRAEFPER
ncbi:PAS domain-containing hybrid sensor histidine kinase/response regulator [Hymenobacter sp. IS2118]|uniref:PAS domain-containing hybrid sensor histidine kinase/response regulator n=1 Tax=Hymenobacter sp. IS2118 TaxID=1505605 RepID=UPI00054FF57D|nr:PAS domain-containing hybrid sensor histidine kinase/response regulator [Hymenobacter sp. IS2118]